MWKPHQPQLVTTDACPSLSLITGLFKCFSNLYFKICWHVWKNYLCPLDAGAHLNLAACCTMRLWSGCSNVEVWALCAALHSTHYVAFGVNQFLVWVFGWIWSTLKCRGWRKFSWVCLINRLHKGWRCCSVINFVSPWVVSEQGNVFYCCSLTLV